MKKSDRLFLFTITPVQDFISQSRKLRDLLGSSQILTDLSAIGMQVCVEAGAQVVFPYYTQGDTNRSYPNRFMVKFTNIDEKRLEELAKTIENSMKAHLQKAVKTDHPQMLKHIENYFNYYWAWCDIEDDYKNAFDIVEKRLAGAKNTRFFRQLGDGLGEVGRKCSVCGERNVVVHNGLNLPDVQIRKDDPIREKRTYIVQKGEGLCGVCYLKRIYSKKSFESTAEIAMMHILHRLDMEQFPHLRKDAQLLYEENLTKEYFRKNGIEGDLKIYQDEFAKFEKMRKDLGLKTTPYYAVIMFDGDSMGEWLSGKKLRVPSETENFHRFLSQKLGEFAAYVKSEIGSPKGVTVYAGGEDFLGFINLHSLFEVLQVLRSKWDEMVAEPLAQNFDFIDNERLTFSAGVVLAHYKTPLGAVLQKAREAEKAAKEYRASKDMLCIVAMKRSGDKRSSYVDFSHLHLLPVILRELQENYSDRFMNVLDEEFEVLGDPMEEIVLSELKRLLKRAKLRDDLVVDPLFGAMKELLVMDYVHGAPKNFMQNSAIANFVNNLYLLRFIKRQIV